MNTWLLPASVVTVDVLADNLPSDPEFLVAFDFASDSIVNIAADCKADLIVMGVNQAAWVRASAHMPWAVAHEVVAKAQACRFVL
jgi:hypothetical protein